MKKRNKKIEKKKIPKKGIRLPIDFLIIALLFPLFALTMLSLKKPLTPYTIPPEKIAETRYWKTYQNNDFFFSFKYPEYILSNFTVETFTDTYQKVKGISHKKEVNGVPTYNVFFEANAWKYKGSLNDFIKKGPLKIKNYKTQEIVLSDLHGLRVTNTGFDKQDAYYEYNLFKNRNHIYNFAIISDEAVLVNANTLLLESILATAKFY